LSNGEVPRFSDSCNKADEGHYSGNKLSIGGCLEVQQEDPHGCLAELAQKPALVLKEYAQHFWNDKDDLTMRDIQQKLLQ